MKTIVMIILLAVMAGNVNAQKISKRTPVLSEIWTKGISLTSAGDPSSLREGMVIAGKKIKIKSGANLKGIASQTFSHDSAIMCMSGGTNNKKVDVRFKSYVNSFNKDLTKLIGFNESEIIFLLKNHLQEGISVYTLVNGEFMVVMNYDYLRNIIIYTIHPEQYGYCPNFFFRAM